MRRLPAALLAALLGFLPLGEAHASRGPALSALSSVAGQSAAQLTGRLRTAHQQTDAALKLRRGRFDAWQTAVEARDAAAAKVERMKVAGQRGPDLEAALRTALVLDEKTNLARSQLMAAEAEVARSGAELLRVYDAVLTLQRREADALPARDGRRESALAAWQALAQQRDKVRRSLGPVLQQSGAIDVGTDVSVAARPDDDVETLLEKADLARDLEERFLRRAQAVERRIQELVEERAVARDVAGLVRSQSLFDEDDMRLRVVSSGVRADPSLPSALPGSSRANEVLASPGGVVVADGSRQSPTAGDDVSGGGSPGDQPPANLAPPPADTSDADPGFGVETINETAASGERSFLPDVSGTSLPRAAERAFSPNAADVDVAALLASGELTLPELRALQKKLRQRASEMKAQSKELKDRVKDRGR